MTLVPSHTLAQSAENGHAQVIAQGVDAMPRVPVAWRVTESSAEPLEEGEFFSRTLGFTIGAEDPILVASETSGLNALLNPGQAAFHPEGVVEQRSSTSSDKVEYLNIELIVADAVDSLESIGSSRLLAVSGEFRAPRGDRELRLTRDVLAPAEAGAFEAPSNAPYLVFVTSGAVQVTGEDGEITEIPAGDAAELTGDIELLGGASEGATWLIAAIGDKVELPKVTTPDVADETGSLEMRLEFCPDGFEEPCVSTTNTDITVPAFHHVDDENWIIPDRAEVSDDESVYTYTKLPAGKYTTGPEEDPQTGLNIDGATWDDDQQGWEFRVRDGKTTVLTLQIAGEPANEDTGSLLVTLYDCPAGIDPTVDDSDCTIASEPWNVLVEHAGQSETTTWSLSDDALDLGEGQFWFEFLPATDLVFWPDDRRDAGLDGYAIGGDPEPLGNIWTVTIPYQGAAEAAVYRLAEDGDGDTGWLTLVQFACPVRTSPDDLSVCETTGEPHDVMLEDVETGESWSAFADAEAESDAQYLFPALPAGRYAITGYDPDDAYDVYFSGDVGFGDGAPMLTIAADTDHDLFIYYVPIGEDPTPEPTEEPVGGSGSLVIAQIDCEYGTDPTVDTSTCVDSSEPWEVIVTSNDSGQTWSMLMEAVAWSAGTYVFEALPAGSYSVSVVSNENWTLYYPTSVEVTADDEAYVTVYSVDLREP